MISTMRAAAGRGLLAATLGGVGFWGGCEEDSQGASLPPPPVVVPEVPQDAPAVFGGSTCASASAVGLGQWRGAIDPSVVALEGVCGIPGPAAYFTARVEVAGDLAFDVWAPNFDPQLGVRLEACTNPWEICVTGGTGWLTDVPAGAHVLIGVAAPVDQIPPEHLDSLGVDFDFTLGIRSRRVLREGEPCLSGARCEAGTGCDGVCTRIPGDLCSSAFVVDAPPGVGVDAVIPAALAAHDDHQHTCGGWRVPDWVYRVNLPEPDGRFLEISSAPGVVIAVRAPGCLPSDELRCGVGSVTLEPSEWNAFAEISVFVEADRSDLQLTWLE